MRKEILRGYLEECFQHYVGTLNLIAPKGSKGAALAKGPLVEFCGVTVSTVTRWFNQKVLPAGETLIKLMSFLDLVGYRVIEFERLPKVRRNFAELIGYGLLSGQEAGELLGYKKTSSLYLVLQGREGISQGKKGKMWEIWKERRAELEEKKKEAAGKIARHEASSPDGDVWQLIRSLLDIVEAGEFPAKESWPEPMINDIFRLGACLSGLASQKVLCIVHKKGGGQ